MNFIRPERSLPLALLSSMWEEYYGALKEDKGNSPGNQNFVNLYRNPGVMTSERHIIKVDNSITPIHYTKRTEPVLTVGADYYVCFGNNIAYPCTLKEII